MRVLFVILSFSMLAIPFNLYCQCSIYDFVPFKMGTSKFEVVKNLKLNKNVEKVNEFFSYWDVPDYLAGDSVYRSQVNFEYRNHECVSSNADCVVLLNFSDGILFDITVRFLFTPDDLENCLGVYDELVSSMRGDFPYIEEFDLTALETNEKGGEGSWMYHSELEAKDLDYKRIDVSYEFVYEHLLDPRTNKLVKSGKIRQYRLDFSFVDLTCSALDSRGY
jgi:hypothetical protein